MLDWLMQIGFIVALACTVLFFGKVVVMLVKRQFKDIGEFVGGLVISIMAVIFFAIFRL